MFGPPSTPPPTKTSVIRAGRGADPVDWTTSTSAASRSPWRTPAGARWLPSCCRGGGTGCRRRRRRPWTCRPGRGRCGPRRERKWTKGGFRRMST
ncbi:hypothetical protein MUK42_27986 [Musa troglodytarum]|uniref:Uncharacterized protein n=1 Tax=Musa troglodytarum TaxID=320322 RepID=A0A9E7JLN3_9LILI|nr:hypothetical protein MUK42_27986 [Musa troglodytarum]